MTNRHVSFSIRFHLLFDLPVCYSLQYSSRLQDPKSTLVEAFKEKELKKHKDFIDEPMPELDLSDTLKKEADKVLLPGDKCDSCKARRAKILSALRKVLYLYTPTLSLAGISVGVAVQIKLKDAIEGNYTQLAGQLYGFTF